MIILIDKFKIKNKVGNVKRIRQCNL